MWSVILFIASVAITSIVGLLLSLAIIAGVLSEEFEEHIND